MQKWIKEVGRGKRGAKDLSYEEALEAAKCITSGDATEAQMAAFLMAERIKTESPYELLAFILEYRRHTERLEQASAAGGVLDCGGPYNGRNSFAATIPVNILLAQQGLPVFLHASESLPPKNGTSLKTILEKLSVPVAQKKGEVQAALEAVNIGFAWTDKLCPPLAALRKVRMEMGVRTIMNTVEKLLDMSGANSIILGVFHRTAVNKIVPSLQQLNYERAYIVQGVEGSEDLPVHRSSFIYKISREASESVIIDPSDYGLKHVKELNKEVLDADEQAGLMIQLLAGEQTESLEPYRNQVVLNAGLRFYLLGHTSTIEEGTILADRLLAEKKGEEHLNLWRGVLQGISAHDNF